MAIKENDATLQYECPHCKTAVEISDQLLHETIDCPHCNKPFSVRPPAARMLTGREAQKTPQAAKGPLDFTEIPAKFGTMTCETCR